ncbi:hypothetical protein [Streptomyces phaeoluteigriseus]|uniref:hypothetical protein n=1 Tax=Streptomyces phaeoluteigriseus TaxID=114686 RepID=UPI00117FFF20|nr:hypothetical protein [Streptomyces phaeoluteigriseus]
MTVTVTGCSGGGGSEAKVASAEKGSSSAGAVKKDEPDSEVVRYVERQRKYAACLRKEGLDVPDPDARGKIDDEAFEAIKADIGSSVSALNKCDHLQSPVPDYLAEEMTPTRAPEEITQDKNFADCMQENGVPEYPDPEFDAKSWPKKGAGAPVNETTASYKRAFPLCYEKTYGQKYVPAEEAAG